MKIKSNYLLALVSILAVMGCSKQAVNGGGGPSLGPQGNFSGSFTLIHENPVNNHLDTAVANVTLTLTANASFSVGGDTTKIQAPGNGTFTVDQPDNIITFQDVTVTKRTPLNTPKKHLNGPFLFSYDGSNLHIFGASDTLSYNYVLARY